jgi:hypothetical protein
MARFARTTLLAFSICVCAMGTFAGQSSLDHYDATSPITVTGMMIGMATLESPRPVYLIVEGQDAAGKPGRWAVEAKSMAELRKHGWTAETLRGGETITVRAFRAKRGAYVAETIPAPRRRVLEMVFELAKKGRLLYGTELTLPDGKKLAL